MNRKLMIKILELLEKAYTFPVTAEILMKKTGLYDIDGKFSQIIKYLNDTNKIIVVLVPENRMGLPTGRDKLHKWLQKVDEITITPKGINFLNAIKLIEVNERRNRLIVLATIVIALASLLSFFIGLIGVLS